MAILFFIQVFTLTLKALYVGANLVSSGSILYSFEPRYIKPPLVTVKSPSMVSFGPFRFCLVFSLPLSSLSNKYVGLLFFILHLWLDIGYGLNILVSKGK